MAINSHAFGRVTLTKEDAAKFSRQIKYGRAGAAAKTTAERGTAMNKQFKSGGKVAVKVILREKEALES